MSIDRFSDDLRDTDQTSAHVERVARVQSRNRSIGSFETSRATSEPTALWESVDRPESGSSAPGRGTSVRPYHGRDRFHFLRSSQVNALFEIGRFRVISVSDLVAHSYRGDRARSDQDLRELWQQGLLKDTTVEVSDRQALRVVTLTKSGRRLLMKNMNLADGQPIYHGLKKPREVEHDADLYALYQKEAARIERSGGKPTRVLLDYEMKRALSRDLAYLGQGKDDPTRKAEIAARHGLSIVHGKIAIPDMRLEYQTTESELRHVDLELATRNYRPRAVAAKAAAGFSVYGRANDAARLRRVLDEREITAEIFTL
jgi:hypothetical protein